MKTSYKSAKGYTLAEVLVGMSILAVAVGVASSLAHTSAEVENRNREIGRAHSIIEAAHNLYQLGLPASSIASYLPYDPIVSNIQFSSSNLTGTIPLTLAYEAASITGTIQTSASESFNVTIESVRENPAYR